MKAAGIEPASEIDATKMVASGCEFCNHPCAANALHFWRSKWLELASRDADLHHLVLAWDQLPGTTRDAIRTWLDAAQQNQQLRSDTL